MPSRERWRHITAKSQPGDLLKIAFPFFRYAPNKWQREKTIAPLQVPHPSQIRRVFLIEAVRALWEALLIFDQRN